MTNFVFLGADLCYLGELLERAGQRHRRRLRRTAPELLELCFRPTMTRRCDGTPHHKLKAGVVRSNVSTRLDVLNNPLGYRLTRMPQLRFLFSKCPAAQPEISVLMLSVYEYARLTEIGCSPAFPV